MLLVMYVTDRLYRLSFKPSSILLCFGNLLTSTTLCAGGQIGTVFGMPISGLLCEWFGWESVFYFFGKSVPYLIVHNLITLFFVALRATDAVGTQHRCILAV